MTIPTGCWPRPTLPTTAPGPKPWVSAVRRLNTAMAALSCSVTNTNRSSGEISTSTAPPPNVLVSLPTTALLPCTAAATLSTTAPLSRAATRYLPSWVNTAPLCSPGTLIVWSTTGASPPWLTSTTIASLRVTNVYLPSPVVATANGSWPTVTDWVRTFGSVGALATVDRQAGAVRGASAAPGVPAWLVALSAV